MPCKNSKLGIKGMRVERTTGQHNDSNTVGPAENRMRKMTPMR